MPCLEDGLSSGHTSDADNNNPGPLPPIGISMLMDMKRSISTSAAAIAVTNDYHNDSPRKSISPLGEEINSIHSKREILGQSPSEMVNNKVFKNIDPDLDSLYSISKWLCWFYYCSYDLFRFLCPPIGVGVKVLRSSTSLVDFSRYSFIAFYQRLDIFSLIGSNRPLSIF